PKHFKPLSLTRRFFFGPRTRRFTGHGFDSPSPRRDCFFSYNSKRPDLACPSYMRSTAQFHRVAIQRTRFTADLNNADLVAVLLSKKLLNIGTLPRIRV